ncbi:aspartyl protease family protein [Hymenobacter canadensis]|uniref:Aspartyl protease family protein n=1 Tax=Hymenobacter canadensis TaxID=2999067 RepID=A0ABY7LNL5_9BACT|nr:aspartyl protease family protein [Hymenobacter canadensis]WBA42013.1 aspartyl protease family protein [Hymenobacter canadensis]
MKALLLSVWLLLTAATATLAQPTPTGIRPLDQLVTAINTKSVEPLQPFLSSETRVGSLPATYTPQLLAQLIPGFGPVENVRLVRQTPEGANTRYVCAFTRQGTEKEYDFLITPEARFLELNLAKASVKKIATASATLELTTPPAVTVPMRLMDGLIVVEAEVDGRRGNFLLDSGAPALMLNQREFAANSGETTATAGGMRGVNGSMGSYSYHTTQSFDWAGIRFQNREVPTLDLSSLEQRLNGMKLLGLIGYNLLDQYALTLDYRAAQVQLRKPDPAPAGPAPLLSVPFTLRGHLPILEATAADQTWQLALDSGAQYNLFDQQYAPIFQKTLRNKENVTLQGADNLSRTVVSGQVPELQVGSKLTFRNQHTVFTDISHLNSRPGQAPVQGLVGYPFLSQYRTTIDFVNKQVRFYNW